MTDQIRRLGVPLIFAAGVAWGTATVTLRGKVDAQRYEADLARRTQTDSLLLRELRSLQQDVTAIRRYLCQGHERELGCQQ